MLTSFHGSLDYSGNFCSYSGDHLSFDFLTVVKFNYEKPYLNRFIKVVKENFANSNGYNELIKLYNEYDETPESLNKLAAFYFKNYIYVVNRMLAYDNTWQINFRTLNTSRDTQNVLVDFVLSKVTKADKFEIFWEGYYDYIQQIPGLKLSTSDFIKQGKFDVEKVVEKLNRKKEKELNAI